MSADVSEKIVLLLFMAPVLDVSLPGVICLHLPFYLSVECNASFLRTSLTIYKKEVRGGDEIGQSKEKKKEKKKEENKIREDVGPEEGGGGERGQEEGEGRGGRSSIEKVKEEEIGGEGGQEEEKGKEEEREGGEVRGQEEKED